MGLLQEGNTQPLWGLPTARPSQNRFNSEAPKLERRDHVVGGGEGWLEIQ